MAKKTQQKNRTKEQLIETLRAQKKELQGVRFRLSPEAQKKTSAHRTLRKSIARTMTDLRDRAKTEKNSGTGADAASRV